MEQRAAALKFRHDGRYCLSQVVLQSRVHTSGIPCRHWSRVCLLRDFVVSTCSPPVAILHEMLCTYVRAARFKVLRDEYDLDFPLFPVHCIGPSISTADGVYFCTNDTFLPYGMPRESRQTIILSIATAAQKRLPPELIRHVYEFLATPCALSETLSTSHMIRCSARNVMAQPRPTCLSEVAFLQTCLRQYGWRARSAMSMCAIFGGMILHRYTNKNTSTRLAYVSYRMAATNPQQFKQSSMYALLCLITGRKWRVALTAAAPIHGRLHNRGMLGTPYKHAEHTGRRVYIMITFGPVPLELNMTAPIDVIRLCCRLFHDRHVLPWPRHCVAFVQ